MCTLTLLPFALSEGPALRLAFNRDESRLRPEAIPPRRHSFGDRTAVLPVDPAGGGTWIALSEAGLVFALMNLNPPAMSRMPGTRSRGTIIPSLLHLGSLEEAADAAAGLDPRPFAPFLLLIASASAAIVAEHRHPDAIDIAPVDLSMPRMFTSSGLGDTLAEKPRRLLFEALVGVAPAPRAQDAFHRHRWPDCPHLSVCMSRADARTVSKTVVELSRTSARLLYWPDAPDQPVQPQVHPLPLAARELLCS